MPEISVIMSVYNGEEYLAQTIESVINQTFENWELVVINDCSKDSTAEILGKYCAEDERIKVYSNEVNLRLPASLNKAISLCRGKYIARMDADDICMPERFEKQYEFMEKNPEISLSSCRFLTLKNGVYSSGGCGSRCDNEAIRAMLLVANPILHPGVIAKADVMKSLLYDTTRTCTEDLELWTRFAMNNLKMEILPEYLLIYRLHDKQITSTTLEKQHKEVLEIQDVYYGNLLEKLDAESKKFHINGVYFRENTDINKLRLFFKRIREVNKKTHAFTSDALGYAFFEILAEYKRHGVAKADIIKAMTDLNVFILIKEILRRKKSARADGISCIEAAKRIGLKKTSGTVEFPVFSGADRS